MVKGTKVVFPDIRMRIERGDTDIPVEVGGAVIMTKLDVSDRQRKHLLAGGTLNFVREQIARKV
jgi:aconitate hydratase